MGWDQDHVFSAWINPAGDLFDHVRFGCVKQLKNRRVKRNRFCFSLLDAIPKFSNVLHLSQRLQFRSKIATYIIINIKR